jgi:RNA methyltransferase, TrmH family
VFPLHKLAELPAKSRRRKIARILQSLEIEHGSSGRMDRLYARGLLSLLADDPEAGGTARGLLGALEGGAEPPVLQRGLNSLRHCLLQALECEPSEWDLLDPATGSLDRTGTRVYPAVVYLEDIRSPFNVGAIFRTAEAFGAERVVLSPRTPLPTHRRASRTARGAELVLPWETAELAGIEGHEGIFALELGGTPMEEFAFPPRGIVLVGSEELGLSPEALRLADRGAGRVSIPQAGAKRSLNVAVAFGILMQKWFSTLAREGLTPLRPGQSPRP